jgi:hypothetical protein
MYVFLFAYLTDLLYFNLKFIWRMIRAIVVVTVWNWMWNYLRLNNQYISPLLMARSMFSVNSSICSTDKYKSYDIITVIMLTGC